jgi:PST family polysaccharide transporter
LSIWGAAAFGLVASSATTVLAIVRSKTTALVLGPEGVGVTSEILQVVSLAVAPLALFTGPALLIQLSRARAAGDPQRLTRIYRGAWSLASVAGVLAIVASLIAGRIFLPSPWNTQAWHLTALAAVFALGGVFGVIPNQVLLSHARLRDGTRAAVWSGALQTTLIVAGTLILGLTGQFLALAAGGILGIFVILKVGSRSLPEFDWRPRYARDPEFANQALRIGSTSLAAGVGMQLALFVVRITLDRHGGPALNGYFQAAWSICSVYFGLVLNGIATYTFPRYASARDAPDLMTETQTAIRFVLRAAPPLILAMLGVRGLLVHTLYSARFSDAAPLIGVMLIGDLSRALVWVLHGVLLYRGHLRSYLAIEVAGISGIAVGAILLVPGFGLMGIGYAYATTYTLLVPLVAIVLRATTTIWHGWNLILRCVATTALLVLGFLLEKVPGGRIVILCAALLWAWRAGLPELLRVRIERLRSTR